MSITEQREMQELRATDAAGQPAVAAPVCPHFGVCGGCRYLDKSYEEQLALKEKEVRNLLQGAFEEAKRYVDADACDALGKLDWFEPARKSPVIFGYRNKMEFSFGDEYKDGPLALGMHKKGSFYDIVTVDGCQIVDEDYRRIIRAVRDYFDARGIAFFHKKRKTGYLRHLMVRKALHTGEIMIDLVTASWNGESAFRSREAVGADTEKLAAAEMTAPAPPEMTAPAVTEADLLGGLSDALLELPLAGSITGILHTVNDRAADAIIDEGTTILYGRDYFYEELLGLRFRITPFSFFQTNSFGAEVLYGTAREYLSQVIPQGTGVSGAAAGPVIYDLYSGTGTIAQMMAPAAGRVIGVEIVREAVEAAKENAALNGITNCEFIADDVLQAVDHIGIQPDLIILDPPRDGIHPKALPRILKFGVPHILYISCKPKSLARDLPAFLAAGYAPVRGCCVDEFPWTQHVETIVLLQKLNS